MGVLLNKEARVSRTPLPEAFLIYTHLEVVGLQDVSKLLAGELRV